MSISSYTNAHVRPSFWKPYVQPTTNIVFSMFQHITGGWSMQKCANSQSILPAQQKRELCCTVIPRTAFISSQLGSIRITDWKHLTTAKKYRSICFNTKTCLYVRHCISSFLNVVSRRVRKPIYNWTHCLWSEVSAS